MLRKILIANRGEIAVRVMRTARRMGLSTVAVYSDADRSAMHVALADEAIPIGPAPATESYLDVGRIIAAARAAGADCVHPGYGFLSESPALAEACEAAGIVLVGPSADAMRQLGDKAAAKRIANAAGIPTVPGYDGTKQDPRSLEREAARIGFPLLIKAVAGGGGRGLRVVTQRSEFAHALASAVREATAAFGDGRVLLERRIDTPRHVEVQVFGDAHGNVVHLYERDCSLQRRHQKVIEEAPAPGMSPELRASLTTAAVTLAKAARYTGAGTVEFLIEGGSLGGDAPWYFIEMNTRLQVEHPVTEAITGLDLVEWQLRVAAGESLPLRQDDIRISGHAIEARLYAEDPKHAFQPSVGRLAACEFPSLDGIRIDTGVRSGDVISAYYDPMIAKLIASGRDRSEAIDRLAAALNASRVAGPATNASLLAALLTDADVRAGHLDTGLIGRNLDHLVPAGPDLDAAAAGFARLLHRNRHQYPSPSGPWGADDAFQLGPPRRSAMTAVVDGAPLEMTARWEDGTLRIAAHGGEGQGRTVPPPLLTVDGDDVVHVLAAARQTTVGWPVYEADDGNFRDAGFTVSAPITGRIAKMHVAVGDIVAPGDCVAVVEAMKMEYVLHADTGGRIAHVHGGPGSQVTQGTVIAEIEPVDIDTASETPQP